MSDDEAKATLEAAIKRTNPGVRGVSIDADIVYLEYADETIRYLGGIEALEGIKRSGGPGPVTLRKWEPY